VSTRRKPLQVGQHLYKAAYWKVVHIEVVAYHSTWRGRYYDVKYDNGYVSTWTKIDRNVWLDSPVDAWKQLIEGHERSLQWYKECIRDIRKDMPKYRRALARAERLQAAGKIVHDIKERKPKK